MTDPCNGDDPGKLWAPPDRVIVTQWPITPSRICPWTCLCGLVPLLRGRTPLAYLAGQPRDAADKQNGRVRLSVEKRRTTHCTLPTERADITILLSLLRLLLRGSFSRCSDDILQDDYPCRILNYIKIRPMSNPPSQARHGAVYPPAPGLTSRAKGVTAVWQHD